MPERSEGWAWPLNSQKAHFFTESGRSLCGKWAYMGERSSDAHPSNCCAECRKRREKELLRTRQPESGNG